MREPETTTVPATGRSFFTPGRIALGMTAFLWLGLAARSLRFLLRFPLWEDECFLCVNLIDRGFADLLEPLEYHQVAPPLFLWLQRAMVLAFGYSEWSLRVVPFAASVASLFLFRRLASRLVSGPTLLLAFAVFAVSYPGIRYAAEAKQYATDLLAALLFLAAAAEWRRTRSSRWLWSIAAAAPALMWLSYPAAFAAGGASLAVGATLLHDLFVRDEVRSTSFAERLRAMPTAVRSQWLAWAALNVAVLVGFGSVYFVIKRQSGAELGFMAAYWQAAFPPIAEPWRLPLWFVATHSGDLVAWPVGGGHGASAFTGLLLAFGVWALARRRDVFLGLLLLAPAGLNLVAAALHRYPYGGHVKFSMFLGPAVCILAGWGAFAWNDLVRRRRPRLANGLAAATVFALGFVGVATAGRDLQRPFKTWSDERARGFAEWFWFNAEAQGDVRLVEDFGGRPFSPDAGSDLSWTAMFLCNRAIYSPTFRDERRFVIPDLERRPLRCVVYRDPKFGFDAAVRDAWLASMGRDHRLVGVDSYPFTRVDKQERTLRSSDYLDIYTFLPRTPEVAAEEWPRLR